MSERSSVTVIGLGPMGRAIVRVLLAAGTEVTVFGSESSEEEAGAMQDALDVFAEQNDMTITFVGAPNSS